MKKLLLALMLVPLAFAAWESTAAIAIVVSATILGALYAVGSGFGINELQLTAKEEFFQLIALMVMMVTLVGTNGLINSISTNDAFAQDSATLQDAAISIIDSTKVRLDTIFITLANHDLDVSKEASKAAQCSFMGIGYSISGCGGFSMLSTPLSMGGGIAGFAIGELSAMRKLLDISKAYALNFILPLGIVLRTFKFTRGAGGFLIALAVSMHILLPAGVVFNEMLAVTFAGSSSFGEYSSPASGGINECNAADVSAYSIDSININGATYTPTDPLNSNEAGAIQSYSGLRMDIRSYMYDAMIRATLGPVLALLMMMAGIRAIGAVAGADVDVSPIARFV